MRLTPQSFFREEDGSQLVEFAVCSSVWFMLSFSIMYGSLLLYADHFVANAAKEAARFAVVRGSSWNGASCATSASNCTATAADVSSYIARSLPPGLVSNNLNVSTTWPGTSSTGASCDTSYGANSPDCAVNVQVTYSFSVPLPFVPAGTVPLSASSRMSILE